MLKIAHLIFSSPFVLAPLAGYSDLPFRLLCRQYGAGFCVSEMISSHGLLYRQKSTLDMMESVQEEKPVVFQLFGADPDIMADAAEIMNAYQPDMIDINMGCPVKKVTKRGAGAALMTNPKLAATIIHKVVKRTVVPVTVKIRSGKDSSSINADIIAKIAEDQGASAVIVHARTWAQGFSGHANRSIIAAVKQAITIPVLGNGDVISRQDGFDMMDETGCDGIMIGRGALGSPWIFSDKEKPDTLRSVATVAQDHLRLMEKFLPIEHLLGYTKNQMSRYCKGFPGSSSARRKIFEAASLQELREIMEFIGTNPS